MIDIQKCNKWAKAMLELIDVTKELTDNEAEFIKQKLKIEFAQVKIDELLKSEKLEV